MFCKLCMVIVRLLAREINAHFKEISVRNVSFSGSCASEKFDFLKFDFLIGENLYFNLYFL